MKRLNRMKTDDGDIAQRLHLKKKRNLPPFSRAWPIFVLTLIILKFCAFIDSFDVDFDEQKFRHFLAMFRDGLIRSFVAIRDRLDLGKGTIAGAES